MLSALDFRLVRVVRFCLTLQDEVKSMLGIFSILLQSSPVHTDHRYWRHPPDRLETG